MGRNKKERCCRPLDSERYFVPKGVAVKTLESVTLEIDEFEAIRLCDCEKLNQIDACKKMKVSRATVQRLLESGRCKLINAFLCNKSIRIMKA
jgi:uncharacterized protein